MNKSKGALGSVGLAFALAGILTFPSTASAAVSRPMDPSCQVDTVDSHYMDSLGYEHGKTRVNVNQCGRPVRAWVHCNHFPYGTNYGTSGSSTSVGATLDASCVGTYMSNGHDVYYNGQWVRYYA